MPRIQIKNEDLLRSKLLPPGWYDTYTGKEIDVTSAGQNAKNPGSALYVFKMKVETHPDLKDVPLRFQISEIAPGMAIPLLKACGWQPKVDNPDLNACVDKHIQAFVQRGSYNGRDTNEIVDFRPRAPVKS